ncbi:MAG: hypothetical protein ABGX83_10435 [Nitrospira sp.]|nr:hypothetical protein [Candidatus Manganitrophaceae bacterium]HIL34545.1 hypothetical protein [Candidatus Manganitrophaceae bacterium]
MKLRRKTLLLFLILLLLSFLTLPSPVLADEEHSHPEKKEEHHHSSSKKKEESVMAPGAKEVRINLSGPFCHRHPEEIHEALMKQMGVKAVEGFSGRKYTMVQYMSDHITPEEIAATVRTLEGNGWNCKRSQAK